MSSRHSISAAPAAAKPTGPRSVRTGRFPIRILFPAPARAYWPVVVGASVAIMLVGTGLTLAVHKIKRTETRIEQSFEPIAQGPEPLEAIPALILETGAPAPAGNPELMPAPPPSPNPPPEAGPVTEETPVNVAFSADASLSVEPPDPVQDAKSCATYGTSVNFMRSPAAAARRALKEDKLVFNLHVSGNFEDPQFT